MAHIIPLPDTHSAAHLAADIGAGAAGAGYVAASALSLVHGVESVVAGALVIVLLALRVRSHLRRDAADRRDGRQ